jgi:dihydrofolate reductase
MISIIAALSENKVIGKDQALPWELPGDLKRFRRITKGHPVIMGRKSYEAIGKALPKRTNIVLTRNEDYELPDAKVFHKLKDAIGFALELDKEVFVIGGESIFRDALEQNLVDKMYLTHIHKDFEGDTFFPEFNNENWNIARKEENQENGIDYTFIDYVRS